MAVNQNQIIQNLLTEKQGNRKVYRTMNCNLLTEKGNTKCSECSACYYEIFEQVHILFSSQIMGVLRDSRLKGMTFNDIFQRLSSRYYKHRKKSPQFVALIQETLIKDESFKEYRKEGKLSGDGEIEDWRRGENDWRRRDKGLEKE